MKILKDLWDGKMAPCENLKSTHDEKRLQNLILNKYEAVSPTLSPEIKGTLDELMDWQGELASLNDCKIFIEGFRMGAKLMQEILETPAEN